jgi:prefoldin subunit 5
MVIKLDEPKKPMISIGKVGIPSLQMPSNGINWLSIVMMIVIFGVMLYGYHLFLDKQYDDTSLKACVNSINDNMTKAIGMKADKRDLMGIETTQTRLSNWTNTFNNRLDALSDSLAKLNANAGNLSSMRSDIQTLQKNYNDLKTSINQLNTAITNLHLNTTSAPTTINHTTTTNYTHDVPSALQFQYDYPCMISLMNQYDLGHYTCLRADCNRNVGWQQDACDCWATFSAADKYRC